MKNFKLLKFLTVLSLSCPLLAQKSTYIWPLDSSLALTGNYGEIRPNHFHTGIDLSTNGREGLPVQAIADGTVSRIRISSGGYGRCVYIRHDNGQVSVYAHLSAFNTEIHEALFTEINKRQVYELDLTAPAEALRIRQGQIIGYSGNSGSSTGPHLHFEIRDDKTEIPYNPLLFLKKTDHVPPQLNALAWYDVSDLYHPRLLHFQKVSTSAPIARLPDYRSPSSNIAFAFAASDYMSIGGSKNQVTSVRLMLDGTEIYAHSFTALRFESNRFVNEFADKQGGYFLQKCFLPENYPAGIYTGSKTDGRIFLKDTLWHSLKLELRDDAGNVTAVEQSLRCHIISPPHAPECKSHFVAARINESIATPNAILHLPANTLYNSICMQLKAEGGRVQILPAGLNFSTAFRLAMPVPAEMRDKTAKLIFRNANSVYRPELGKDSLYLEAKNSGTFTISTDLQNPEVKALWKSGKGSARPASLRFLMRDDLSGIERYELFVNGKWTFAYYDIKKDQLILETKGLPKGTLHLRLFVSDKCENVTLFSSTF